MQPSVAFGLAGLIASALKVFVAGDQATISRKSIADVILGGAVGILYPLYPLVPMPEHATLLQQSMLVGVICYFSSDLITNVLAKLGVAQKQLNPDSTRAEAPKP